ncbi:TetR/AcrR family transcriptional regulator [Streptomyces avicenniae]|uniref:TetR/AcrR family transcriptional regulator n=1 Tax=Streptomyces avicenniae TaxID=500153 RepID=UPI00069AE005|nr:TetR/AcrR family transcriptional regulator [Streptomyces avicenniae]
MAHGHQQRRSDTRQRIQDVALELFAEQGYEKTSLREIAERLGVTKAALYYHFKAKEDIVISLFEDLTRPIDEVAAWGRSQPPTLETRLEILRRYSAALHRGAPLFRFMQENQATVRELSVGATFKHRMMAMTDLMTSPDAPVTDQVRCLTALFAVHASLFWAHFIDADEDEMSRASLTVATELVTSSYEAREAPAAEPGAAGAPAPEAAPGTAGV